MIQIAKYARCAPGRGGAKAAMTLVEVLVALTLLTVGLGGVMNLYTDQIRAMGRTQNQSRAHHLARGYLAQIQTVGYADLKSRYLEESAEAFFGPAINKAPENTKFWWNARLKREEGADLQGLAPRIKISIRVGWGAAPQEDSPKMDAPIADRIKTREVTGYAVAP